MSPLSRISAVRERSRARVKSRLLEAAEQFVANQGVARLSMSEVGRLAGVGSGTVYRQFPTREALLGALASREAGRFLDRVEESLKPQPGHVDVVDALVRHTTSTIREYTILCELLEAEPGFVLRSLRDGFGTVRESVGKLITPWLAEHAADRTDALSDPQLVDLVTRVLVSHFLIPEAQPERAAREVADVLRSVLRAPAVPSAGLS